jgi:hypothetical protein
MKMALFQGGVVNLQKNEIIHYGLHVVIPNAPSNLFVQQEKGELFLTAKCRLSDVGKSACLDSPTLAEEFLSALMPRLQKRYGPEVKVEICRAVNFGTHKQLAERIKSDSSLVRARIKTGILASNRKPE